MVKLPGILLGALVLCAQQCNPTPMPSVSPGGPSAWIDAPLNGAQLPLAPIEIVSHASDPNRIVQVELNVNGDVVRRDPNPDVSQNLVTTRQQWSPPAPGNYTLLVRAQSTTSAWGEYARTVVTILGGTITPAPTTITPTIRPATTAPVTLASVPPGLVSPTLTRTRTPTLTSPAPTITIAFSADPPSLAAGQCTTIRWQVTNAARVFVDDAPVAASGSKRDCPTRITMYSLRVITRDNQTVTRSLTVSVVPPSITAPPPAGCVGAPNITSFTASPSTISPGGSSTLSWGAVTNADSVEIDHGVGGVATPGSTGVSPASTTTYTLTARCGSNLATRQVSVTVSTPQDTTGPTISDISASPSIFYRASGCGAVAVTVRAHVTDPSGIANVTLFYRVGSSGSFTSASMSFVYGDFTGYSRTVNASEVPGTNLGTWQFYIMARDNVVGLGNTSQSALYTNVTLAPCIR